MSNINSLFMKKLLVCCMLLMICTAQPAEANKWRHLLPPLSRSLRHINDKPMVSYSSRLVTGSDNPWNFIMPCLLIAGGAYLLWPLFKEEEERSESTSSHCNHQPQPTSSTPHEIILANGGGVLLR